MADFQQILTGFRELWAELGKRTLSLNVLLPEENDGQERYPDLKGIPVLCRICLPKTCEFETFGLEGWVICHHPTSAKRLVERFQTLCEAAGANLPTTYFSSFRSYQHSFESSPITWWLALYLFVKGVTERRELWPAIPEYGIEGTGEFTLSGILGLSDPLPDMIRIIETLRLNTGTPAPIEDWFPTAITAFRAGQSDVLRCLEEKYASSPMTYVPDSAETVARGVSLRDVAELLCEGERSCVRETKRRWQNSRSPRLPSALGKDSEDSRANLYSLSALFDFLKIVENYSDTDLSSLRGRLRHRIRPVRAE